MLPNKSKRSKKYLHFFFMLPIAFFLLWIGAALLFDSSSVVYDAEFSFSSHMPGQPDGARIVPASCDSGILHGPGDLDACPWMGVWTEYCTGSSDPNGNNWQWWRYSDSFGDRRYEFVRPGDGNCTPDAPTNLRVSCAPGGGSATIEWDGGYGATTYYPRIWGNGANCPWLWSLDSDGATCYYNSGWYGNSFTTFLNPGSWHRAWVHSGNPINWGKVADLWFQCPLHPAPTNVTYSCDPWGTAATVTWDPVPGATRYLPRIYGIEKSVCDGWRWPWVPDGVSGTGTCYSDSWPTSTLSMTFPLRPGYMHSAWVHAGDPVSSSGSTGQFSCIAPPIKTGDGSCSADGLTGTISWNAPPTYTHFYVRASAVGLWQQDLLNVPDGLSDPWEENYSSTTKTFATEPGKTYYWWVHTKHPATGAWSDIIQGQFTCPLVPPPRPELLGAMCDPDSPTTGRGALWWKKTPGATSYNLRVREVGTVTPPGCGFSGPSYWCVNGITETSFAINSMPLNSLISPTSKYVWWLHALNAAGNSGGTHSSGVLDFRCIAAPRLDLKVKNNFSTGPLVDTLPTAPLVIAPGENIDLTWTSTNASVCGTVNTPDVPFDFVRGRLNATETRIGPNPGSQIEYRMYCENSDGDVEDAVYVRTDAVTATVRLDATPAIIPKESATQLSWNVTTTYPLQCSVFGGTSAVPDFSAATGTSNGTVDTGTVSNTTDFTISCAPVGYTGPAFTDVARVEVIPQTQPR
jgi:hypothetical protein